jgi:hypothetical protein
MTTEGLEELHDSLRAQPWAKLTFGRSPKGKRRLRYQRQVPAVPDAGFEATIGESAVVDIATFVSRVVLNQAQPAGPMFEFATTPMESGLNDVVTRLAAQVELLQSELGSIRRAMSALSEHSIAHTSAERQADPEPNHSISVDDLEVRMMVWREYVRLVRPLPHVQRVVLTATRSSRIWTIFDAEPFAREYRDPIYDAEQKALDLAGCDDLDFRLINVRELRGKSPVESLDDSVRAVWERET